MLRHMGANRTFGIRSLCTAVWFFLFILVFPQVYSAYGKSSKGKTKKLDSVPVGFDQVSALEMFDYNDRTFIKQAIHGLLNHHSNNTWATVRGKPNSSYPFMFFHQRQAGGGSLRTSLASVSVVYGVKPFIACATAPCDSFEIPRDKLYSIYAGHFQWGEQNIFNKFGGSHHRDHFSCITNFRQPIPRLLTCIYQELEQQLDDLNVQCISELRVSELAQLLMRSVDERGNSCLNEPFRILSGQRDEEELKRIGLIYDAALHTVDVKLKPNDIDLLEMTARHVRKCVPLIHEMPESLQLLGSTFPAMHKSGSFFQAAEDHEVILPKYARKCDGPNSNQMVLLQQVTALEKILYENVVRVAKLQLAFLEKHQAELKKKHKVKASNSSSSKSSSSKSSSSSHSDKSSSTHTSSHHKGNYNNKSMQQQQQQT